MVQDAAWGSATPIWVAAAPHETQRRRQASVQSDSWRMFLAGGTAGAIARTTTAPLDRIKLLFQVQAVPSANSDAQAYTSVRQAFMKIYREEGVLAFWKGNGANVIRIFPYSAAQLAANDTYKRLLEPEGGRPMTVPRRLAAGAGAGMTATTLTHPLDVVRLRLALPNSPYKGIWDAARTIVQTEGMLALYKGLAPTLIGIAPFTAINFTTYDLLKQRFYGSDRAPQSAISNLALGGTSGFTAASICYPLDTIRRRMQMAGHMYDGQLDAFRKIWEQEGARGFYRGFTANALKTIPSNGIRFVAYEWCKRLYGVQKARTDT
jgi:solute carrier family 25 phosphate transporter 23/24/25/41